jgi:hypothetical protein
MALAAVELAPHRQVEVVAPVVEGAAARSGVAPVLVDLLRDRVVVVVLVAVPLHRAPEALELRIQDEVDHAGNGVGAVGGRGPAGQEVDPLHECRRDEVQVRARNERIARSHAVTVDEGQRALRAQVAQVHRRRTRRPVGDRGVLRREYLRQRLHQVFDTARPLIGDLFRFDDGDRAQGLHVRAGNQRARDRDLFAGSNDSFFLGLLDLRLLVLRRLRRLGLRWLGLLWLGLLLRGGPCRRADDQWQHQDWDPDYSSDPRAAH